MPRFFVEGEPQGEYFLGGEDGRHAARALRLRAGEPVTLCDGQGWDYACTVLRGEERFETTAVRAPVVFRRA